MEKHLFVGKWDTIKPSPSISTIQSLNSNGFVEMTPVQAATVPVFLSHKDVVVEAITGSGKTLSFLVPILEILMKKQKQDNILPHGHIGAMIIAPTRELAEQIHQVSLKILSTHPICHSFNSVVFTGFKTIDDDISDLVSRFNDMKQPIHIMVGTPGRICQLLTKQTSINIRLQELEVLVLDEADRLLDMGFSETIRTIISKCPKQRRTGLFSATMTDEVEGLVTAGLRNPVKILVQVKNKTETISNSRIPGSLSIYYHITPIQHKLNHLMYLLHEDTKFKHSKILIYFATCAMVDYFYLIVSGYLNSIGVNRPIFHIHRKLDQKKRQHAFEKFKTCPSNNGPVMLCTDLAARGLDIPDIDSIIQFDPPQDPKAFIHRCGRAGRMGKHGTAIVYLTPNEDTYVNFLSVRKVPMTNLPFDGEYQDSIYEYTRLNNCKKKDWYEKSMKAFVSYIRFYQEHQAKFIFQLKKMDMIELISLFGLVNIPKMKELDQHKKQISEQFISLELGFQMNKKK